MTYAQLLNHLLTLTPSQLQLTVQMYDLNNDVVYVGDEVRSINTAMEDESVPEQSQQLPTNCPYIVFDSSSYC